MAGGPLPSLDSHKPRDAGRLSLLEAETYGEEMQVWADHLNSGFNRILRAVVRKEVSRDGEWRGVGSDPHFSSKPGHFEVDRGTGTGDTHRDRTGEPGPVVTRGARRRLEGRG